MNKIDTLVAAEDAERASEDKLIALLTTVSQQLAALKDSGGASDAQLQVVIDKINANTANLDAAAAANTPAPAPTPAPQPAPAPAPEEPTPPAT